MNANPGDLVVAIRDSKSGKVLKGRTYRVERITPSYPHERFPYGYKLTGIMSNGDMGGFYADMFRKIRPDEHEDCEPEFVELLNRIKPVVPANQSLDK